ncbi:MAG: two-component system sensor histidine kinase NtrB [Cellvibrionaceae bacterium]
MASANIDINYPLLRIYAYYRLALSSILLLMFSSNMASNILGSDHSSLFIYSSTAYTVLNLITLATLWQRRFEPSPQQIFTLLLIDSLALIIFVHASGGLGSGLGFLLLVTVAVAGILLNKQLCSALAAFTTLLLFTETLYSSGPNGPESRHIFTSGVLGALIFAFALAFNYLSNKLRMSAIEAANQAAHAAHLERLAQLIIERMQTGIVVANQAGEVELINRSAENLLNWPSDNASPRLTDIDELEEHVRLWQTHSQSRAPSIKPKNSQHEVRLRFANLAPQELEDEQGVISDTLIFVEDTRGLHREAQHLKLASLGRLTASIAHEIRNPLGAISHAGQLLAESPELNKADKRLTEIIETNAERVNQIIENVLQLSRRRPTRPESIDIHEWLMQYMRDYAENNSGELTLSNPKSASSIQTRIDASHLSQVVTNLTDNGLRHSQQAIGEARLSYEVGVDDQTQLPYLKVIDEGEGIADDSLTHIFEPFFTTEAAGSGLGLYLSKELCEANHANLNFQRTHDNKSCFRIDFAHPDRMF